MEYARIDEVVARYEGDIPRERLEWVAELIADATSLLRGRLPQLDTWIAAGRVPASEARRVVSEIVLRRVRNPAGMRQESAGPYGRTREDAAASGRLVVLEEELAALIPSDVSTLTGVGSVSLGIPAWRIP